MMKLVILTICVCAAFAIEQRPVPEIKILRLESDISPEGQYSYAYETENGIAGEERGQPIGPGEDAGTGAQGSFRYTSPEGLLVQVNYAADEGGFQPVGDSIPTPPPIPDAIAKALAYNSAHPSEENDEKLSGQYNPLPVAPQIARVAPKSYSPVGVYSLTKV